MAKKQIFDNTIKPWLKQPPPNTYKREEEVSLKR